MKTQIINTSIAKEFTETVTAVFNHTRSKIISAADVWNIQKHKRTRIQRRVAL